MSDLNLYLPELKRAFSGRKFFRKADLRDFYRTHTLVLSDNAFRRILYALEKQAQIVRVDAGVYRFPDRHTPPPVARKFTPAFSDELYELNDSIKSALPYAEYLLWETRLLHEFMLHQPGQGQIILESERDAAEALFNFLNLHFVGRVFLQPERQTFERYILPRPDSIIITGLVTQSPHQQVERLLTPKLEKILMDVFTDEKIFYPFHGEELVHIFETAFERYWLSQKTLFRYAERRRMGQKLRTFIQHETRIPLIR